LVTEQPRVAIIGCGVLGKKRAKALRDAKLVAAADIDIERARSLCQDASARWQDVVARNDVDIVIVATVNSALAEVAAAVLDSGKHVLIEKPAARNVHELDRVIAAQKRSGKLARVGFNHRYHPAIRKARDVFESGALGPMMFVRGRYGHGGRLGYDREWRAKPELSGGGELIDQGVHLIDLARQFLGEFPNVKGLAQTLYWDMPVDDNAFLTLRTADDRTAFLHVSCTEWKNLFSLEIYGRDAKLHIEGLGGSYGTEKLTYYKMLPQMGPPETSTWEFPGADVSWETEFAEFVEDIERDRQPAAGLEDARATLLIVEEVYRQSGYDID
jgi:predicted dehydrogenase